MRQLPTLFNQFQFFSFLWLCILITDLHCIWKKRAVRGEFPCTALLYNYNSRFGLGSQWGYRDLMVFFESYQIICSLPNNQFLTLFLTLLLSVRKHSALHRSSDWEGRLRKRFNQIPIIIGVLFPTQDNQ